ncbi:excinuclease ABC subunit UvrB [Candidatus Uhrbacteria bacterium]|nr:excinuclease ABC subunit UvrB [Candidatus Uhrbacteria bacterium]
MRFQLVSKFQPMGDQPQAIRKLTAGIENGVPFQTLLGVTGSGKTFTMASVIEKIQRPTLIMSPNKTLAAQLYQEFREFFPNNAVHYIVSYYDYYQPEANIPHTDTYIEKEAMINEDIDRLRHAATQSLLTRKDVIIVASVSCIYGLGSPETYKKFRVAITKGDAKKRQAFLRQLTTLQYQRNDTEFSRGTYRVRGNTVEIHPSYSDKEFVRVEFEPFDDAQGRGERISHITFRDIAGAKGTTNTIEIFPASHHLAEPEKLAFFFAQVQEELKMRLTQLKKEKKITEAERLERRVNYDLEMMRSVGYCQGIENYSRYLNGRNPGEPPFTLLDYFNYDNSVIARNPVTKQSPGDRHGLRPRDDRKSWLLFMDESHIGIPQVRGMYAGDRSRKEVLINYGFRLPSALDNRPLRSEEFAKRIPQTIFVSATPGPHELSICKRDQIIEQLVRPTGLLDPEIEIRKTEGQIPNLLKEIEKRVKKHQRVLVTTLTKRMAEELADYLKEEKIKVTYLHSDIDTMERLDILNDLRKGEYDVLVGINLLREGLDLPEVSLVAILDADKEGFLRNDTTLIQTMGRAARHVEGRVIMYADTMTGSMKRAIEETTRRRKIQEVYNKKHGITPRSITKALMRPIIDPIEKK